MRNESVQIASSRVAAIPSNGVVFEFDVDGNKSLRGDQSTTVRENIDDSLNYRLRLHGGRFFEGATVGKLQHATAFHHWSLDAMGEIVAERLGHTNVKHESVSDWRFGPSIASWRSVLGADFVLISLLIDGHNTAGRAIVVAFAGGIVAARRAISCIVQLEDGRVVWCNFINGFSEDLMQRPGAQSLVDALLQQMLLVADQTPVAATPRMSAPAQAATASKETPASDAPPSTPHTSTVKQSVDPDAP